MDTRTVLRRLAWKAAPSRMADRVVRHSRRVRDQIGATNAAEEFFAAHGDRVLHGPFQGMRYVSRGDAAVPKMLGVYEHEIRPWIEDLINAPPSLFLDLGTADGYYLIGMMTAAPATQAVGFELSNLAASDCKRVAALNGVTADLRGAASAKSVAREMQPGAAVLCDIEGAEVDVFVEPLLSLLTRSTIIVELHDGRRPGITETLSERFAATHSAEIVSHEAYPVDHPELAVLTDAHRTAAMSDLRCGGSPGWVRFTPR